MFLTACDDDDGDDEFAGESVFNVNSRGRLLTNIFVADALDAFVDAGCIGDDSTPNASEAPTTPRTSLQGMDADFSTTSVSRITSSDGASTTTYIARQEAEFKLRSDTRVDLLQRMRRQQDRIRLRLPTTACLSLTHTSSNCEPTRASIDSQSEISEAKARRNKNNEDVVQSGLFRERQGTHARQRGGLSRALRLCRRIHAVLPLQGHPLHLGRQREWRRRGASL